MAENDPYESDEEGAAVIMAAALDRLALAVREGCAELAQAIAKATVESESVIRFKGYELSPTTELG